MSRARVGQFLAAILLGSVVVLPASADSVKSELELLRELKRQQREVDLREAENRLISLEIEQRKLERQRIEVLRELEQAKEEPKTQAGVVPVALPELPPLPDLSKLPPLEKGGPAKKAKEASEVKLDAIRLLSISGLAGQEKVSLLVDDLRLHDLRRGSKLPLGGLEIVDIGVDSIEVKDKMGKRHSVFVREARSKSASGPAPVSTGGDSEIQSALPMLGGANAMPAIR